MLNPVILCVDDERIVLDSLVTQLREAFGDKYSYEMAESADEALELIIELEEEGIKIMVLVSDWLMPGIKGDEFLVRVHKDFPKIVKIMLTGQADEKAIEHARKEGGLFRCLYKPWMDEELLSTINEGLDKLNE